MDNSDNLTCSQKHYLFAIYQLYKQKGTVKTTELAKSVGVSKSSATCMTTKLYERGYLQKAFYGSIELTQKGLVPARAIYNQVSVIYRFLTKQLGIDSHQAKADAVSFVVYGSEQTICSLMDLFLKINNER